MISNSAGRAKQPVAEYSNSPKVESGQMYKKKRGQATVKGNMDKVFEFRILKRFNTLDNIKQGTYASRLVTYNSFTKEFKDVDFSYPHEYTKSNHMGQEETPDSPYTGIMPVYNYEENKLLSDFPEADLMFTSSTIGMHDRLVNGKIEAIETADIENTLQKSKAQKNAFNSFIIELVVPGLSLIHI